MARGGLRPGAGRPKGAKKINEAKAPPPDIRKAARKARLTPLEYMLAVLNDDEADAARRDRMAVAAAPYVHARAEAEKPGKKEQADLAARTAENGTSWDGLIIN